MNDIRLHANLNLNLNKNDTNITLAYACNLKKSWDAKSFHRFCPIIQLTNACSIIGYWHVNTSLQMHCVTGSFSVLRVYIFIVQTSDNDVTITCLVCGFILVVLLSQVFY